MSCPLRHHFLAQSAITHGWKNLCCISPLRRTWELFCLNFKVCPIYLLYLFFFVSFHYDKNQSWIQLCTVSLSLPRKSWMLGMLLGGSATPYCICMALGNSAVLWLVKRFPSCSAGATTIIFICLWDRNQHSRMERGDHRPWCEYDHDIKQISQTSNTEYVLWKMKF